MVCFDEMDPDKAALLVTFEGGGSAYSDDLNNVAYSHKNGLVATSRYIRFLVLFHTNSAHLVIPKSPPQMLRTL